ncbi:hypothetical protein GEMRC1_001024 [Eukaryota sp. GEM-RC1]
MSFRRVSTCSVFSPSKAKNVSNRLEKKISHQTLYKTEMCRLLLENGHCHFGKSCNFAHTESELRPKMCHPRFKTENCKSFHDKGYCPYGSRCRFSHAVNSEPSSSVITNCPSVCISSKSKLIILPDPHTDNHVLSLSEAKSNIKRLPIFQSLCRRIIDSGCTVI